MQNYGVPRYAERIVYAYGGITSQYKYGYDNSGSLVRSIDINLCKEYNYIYENDKIVRAYEYDITLDSAQNATQ